MQAIPDKKNMLLADLTGLDQALAFNGPHYKKTNDKKRARYCECCGDRFLPSGLAKKGVCHACTDIALEIIRVCGPEFVSNKSVLFARMRERLKPLLAASPQPWPTGHNLKKEKHHDHGTKIEN